MLQISGKLGSTVIYDLLRRSILRPLSLVAVILACIATGQVSYAAAAIFPGSELIESSQDNVQRYRLVLSELKHQRADTFGEREMRLAGTLKRSVFQLPSGVGLEEVRLFFRRQIDGERTLYECIGIDCGSSNFWANDVFDVASLVSRDKDQAYFVTLEPYADGHRLTMVYIAMRGGRQPKVLIDELVTDQPVRIGQVTQEEVVAALSVTSGWLPGFSTTGGQLDLEDSQIMLDVIRGLSPGLQSRLHLMVHCYDGAHIGDTLECSDALAEQLRKALPGIDIRGQGALSPAPGADRRPALRFTFWPGR